ncbi:MAG: DNA polymerase III subunit delta, partial [Chloroflexota bacterium]|nr:DNA polymerase III subunit delta [Chloroflexota bacterium]
MIYVFHGDDTFSANEALTALAEAVGPPDVREPNVSRLDAAGFSVNAFMAAAMVVPFLAERRLVVVRGLL